MSITRLNTDLSNISKLADEPNDVGGLTAAELKAEFDKAGNSIKSYINTTLLPFIEGLSGALNVGISPIGDMLASNVQQALANLQEQLQEISQGGVADGSIVTAKLADKTVTTAKLADASITTDKIADDSVTTAKVADGSITVDKMASNAVTGAKIAASVITASKLASDSITTAKIKDGTVTTAKLADGSVSNAKIASDAVTTDKVADGNITRAKLNNDALYSPVVTVSSSPTNIGIEHLGKTLFHGFALRNNANKLILTQEISASLPNGFEVAITRLYDAVSLTVETTGIRVTGCGTYLAINKSYSLPERGSMLALKKFGADNTNGDVWLITGDCEVVS